jgi:hypothetical protein
VPIRCAVPGATYDFMAVPGGYIAARGRVTNGKHQLLMCPELCSLTTLQLGAMELLKQQLQLLLYLFLEVHLQHPQPGRCHQPAASQQGSLHGSVVVTNPSLPTSPIAEPSSIAVEAQQNPGHVWRQSLHRLAFC